MLGKFLELLQIMKNLQLSWFPTFCFRSWKYNHSKHKEMLFVLFCPFNHLTESKIWRESSDSPWKQIANECLKLNLQDTLTASFNRNTYTIYANHVASAQCMKSCRHVIQRFDEQWSLCSDDLCTVLMPNDWLMNITAQKHRCISVREDVYKSSECICLTTYSQSFTTVYLKPIYDCWVDSAWGSQSPHNFLRLHSVGLNYILVFIPFKPTFQKKKDIDQRSLCRGYYKTGKRNKIK